MKSLPSRPAQTAAFKSAVLLGAALSLVGCAGLPSAAADLRAPAATPVAAAWQAPLPQAAGPSAPAPAGFWWARFNDPLLVELIDASRAASPTVAVAAARIERARATRVSARAALLPNINAVASASSGRQTPEPRITTSSASAVMQAGWEIDLFGGYRAGQRAAQARFEGAQAGLADAQVAVAAETAGAYLSLRACEAQRTQIEIDANSRAETARLTAESERAGFTAPADAALVRASAAQARTLLASQRQACDTLIKSLVEVSGLDEVPLRQRLAPGTAVLPLPAPVALQTLPAALLAQRPDLIDSQRAVLAAAAEIDRSRAAQWPQVSLSGSIGGASVRAGDSPASNGATWSIGPLSVSLPIFDGGARAAATQAARAGYDEAVALYQAKVRRAVREVETNLVALQSTAERESDAALAAADFEASLRATQARQRGGLASLFDLETARRNAVAAQSALIDLKRERAAAWIALYRALGGGFEPTSNQGD